ncbi:hypothetical protein IMSHALPRED_004073 [Imshaugia aleurites]|uniref:Rhodopsin domain-containing protein n=1 Tax=Imshaugia aleurites TaxID=172621 RepID=A0A8H3EKC3_9LECA|nr:hypothetical protein IMSHALPRED_004073 [Imshaugia aleurites]
MGQPSRSEYLSISWTFTGLAILLSVGRFIIRKRVLEGLRMDDLTHAFAVIVLIPYQSIGTLIYPVSIQLEAYGATTSPASIATFEKLFRLELAGQFLFWIILYAVKFTFLIFFRQIFGVNRVFMKWWWALFVYTWLAFVASFLTALWVCGDPSDLFVLEKCIAPRTSHIVNNYAEVAFSLNVSSDLAIIILPVYFLRDLQMRLGKKIAVGLLFSVGMLIVVIEALRLGTGDPGGVQKLDSVYNVLEPAIAVIVACLPIYKSVLHFHGGFSYPRKSKTYQYHSGSSFFPKRRLTARYHSEGYELGDKLPSPVPAMLPRHN